MKNRQLLFLMCLLGIGTLHAQTTEVFETETVGSTSFTDNGQVFNITSVAPSLFDIGNYPNTGWNGTGNDDRYIDNSGSATFNTGVEFAVSSAGSTGFTLKSIYLYLSKSDTNLNATGSLTITGKRNGVTKFTISGNSPFNQSLALYNGYTLINFATYAGQNNANEIIDSFVIKTTGNIAYVGLDAMTWQCSAPQIVSSSQTNISCNGGSTGTATVSASGSGLTYNWTPGNPSGDGTASVTGLTAGLWSCTVTNECGASSVVNFAITHPSAVSVSSSQTNVSCNGGSNGTAAVSVSGGAGGYTYSWSPSGGTNATATGLAAGNYTVTVTDANTCSSQKSITIIQPPVLNASSSQTNVSCNGGSNGAATASVSGGVGSYTYSWSPSGGTAATATGLSVGNYTVTITDANSCTIQKNFTITQPTVLTASLSQTNVSCNGGSNGTATASVSGGAGSYSYSWSPSGGTNATATGLSAGNYTVTITDGNSCSIQKNFTLTQPDPLTVASSQTNVSCSGGSNGTAAASVSGGAGDYTYSWSPSGGTAATASGLSAGNYTVTISDATACSIQKNFTITEPNALSAASSQTNVSCNGGSNGTATVSVSGGTGSYTYSWSPSGGTAATASGLSPGSYIVTITDANFCSMQKNFTITEPAILTAISSIDNELSFNGASDGAVKVTVSGGTSNYTYLWNTGATTSSLTGLPTGIYTCTITDANGCGASTSVQLVAPLAVPVAFDVTGGGTLCQGDSGMTIGLSNSETGVAYQLLLDSVNLGAPVDGTGSTISFGFFTEAGSYTVLGTHVTNETSTLMNGAAVIAVINYMVAIDPPVVPCSSSIVTLSATLDGAFAPAALLSEFEGQFAPLQWTVSNQNANGNVNTSNAPASITITGADGATGSGTTDYSIVMPVSGTLSFNWNYSTNDGPQYDNPRFVYNGVEFEFTGFNTSAGNMQSGSMTFSVAAGATVALRMFSVDNFGGPGTVVISNFAVATPAVGPSLLWTASAGGAITGATDGLTATATSSGTYTLTSSSGACSFSESVVVDFNNPTLVLTTWNGSEWSNGLPDVGKKAVVDAPLFVSSELVACEVEITANGSLTVQSNAALNVVSKITNQATATDFVIENTGVLLQEKEVENEGQVTVNATSYPLYRQDYTLWASPVQVQNLRGFSPQTLFNRFSSYDTTLGTAGDYVQEIFTNADVQTKVFEPATGYLIRTPNNWVEYVSNAVPGIPYNGVFTGVPQNGTVSVALATVNGGLNLVGNPYPSPISIPALFAGNSDLEETIYYWRKRNGAAGTGYATYNSMGFISVQSELTDLGATIEAQPLISPGQGFFVKSTGASSLQFNNSMRRLTGNGVFLRSNPIEKHRFWLNLSTGSGTLGQTLIGYIAGGTPAFDNGFDSSYFDDSPVALTSLINGDAYAIQGFGLPFNASSTVALGFKTDVAGIYTLSLANFDGLFAENQDIYIKDNLTGLVHNLKESAYNFTTVEGVFNARFEIVYQAGLGTNQPILDTNAIMVYKQDQVIYIKSLQSQLQKVELFDIRGSLLQVLDAVNDTTATMRNLTHSNQLLLVKITTMDHNIVTKKIIY